MARVFFSYSHTDEALRDQLETHLALLKNQGLIESWHDRRIAPGSEFDQSISEAMQSADVILLLISANFLASAYCYSIELKVAMERHHAGTATVIPVILRDCDWHSAPFGKLNAVPRDGKPITLWPNADQAFAEVAKQIRRVVEARPPAAAQTTSRQPSGGSGTPAASTPMLPRSSNLRLRKQFSEQDRDEFLRAGFDYLARFFEGSLQALQERNGDIRTVFERIDSRRFSAVIYRSGKAAAECSIRLEGLGGRRSDGIAFSNDASARPGSYNEMLSVDADNQSLFLKSMGMQGAGESQKDQLSHEGGAEFLWELLISRLQR
jgi:hypothetical protein